MAGYRVPRHVWRTNDDRLVLTGDPEAAFLAYPAGTEMAEDEAQRRGIIDALAGNKVEDKSRKPAVKPGLTIKRSSDKEN